MDKICTKTCTKCKQTKLIDKFGRHKRSRDGLRQYCKSCNNKYTSENRHNIDETLIGKLLIAQKNKCAICESTKPYKQGTKSIWPIDHDHKTGQVRGLLCQKCNVGLGQFEDSIELLQKAINYLENGGVNIPSEDRLFSNLNSLREV